MSQQSRRDHAPAQATVHGARPEAGAPRTAVPAGGAHGARPGTPGGAMPALRITSRSHDEGLVLVLEGEVDMATERRFHAAAREAVESMPHGRVVLDFSGLDFIDSSGLRVLIQAHKLAKEHYAAVMVAAPNERVSQILRVTAIDTRVPVMPDVAAALAAPLNAPSS